ncbi:MAG: PIG-L family deacetylase [Gammaproteobacteria bacterium]|nr:PIG-L family deacetylase [Gammaproteobacteria bacterium]
MFNQENILIPFHASPLPKGPWLVFAPHADDETFGMGGSLLKAKKEGIETHLVVLTDGSLGGDAENLVQIRSGEVKLAAELLGLKSLQCWSELDRSLDLTEQVLEKVVRAILDLSPATVFFPGPLEIHPDHRATALLVWNALKRVRVKNLIPEPISYEIGVQNPINLLVDITGQSIEKQGVMEVYASQNQENNYPELVTALDKGRTFSLPKEIKYAEGFFRYQLKDLDVSLDEVTHLVIDLYQKLPEE